MSRTTQDPGVRFRLRRVSPPTVAAASRPRPSRIVEHAFDCSGSLYACAENWRLAYTPGTAYTASIAEPRNSMRDVELIRVGFDREIVKSQQASRASSRWRSGVQAAVCANWLQRYLEVSGSDSRCNAAFIMFDLDKNVAASIRPSAAFSRSAPGGRAWVRCPRPGDQRDPRACLRRPASLISRLAVAVDRRDSEEVEACPGGEEGVANALAGAFTEHIGQRRANTARICVPAGCR